MAQCVTYHRCDGSSGTSPVVVGSRNDRVFHCGRGCIGDWWRRLDVDNHHVNIDFDHSPSVDDDDFSATIGLQSHAG